MLYIISLIIISVLTFILLMIFQQHRKAHLLDTAKKKVEIELYEEKSRFETIFERSKQGIALMSLDGHILKANQSLCELLGYNDTDILAMNYFYLISQTDLNKLQINIQHLLDNHINVHQSEHECFNKNGDILWILSTLSLIRETTSKPKYFILQIENITLQKYAEDRLHQMAYHDALTGLANRSKLEHFINHLLTSAKRQQQSFALLFMDLDGFKNINDSIGHDAGDILLQIVSERLRNAVRATDMVARLGGDEFVILITDVKKTDDSAVIAQKILSSILQAIIIKGQDLYVSTSIGISIYPDDGDNLQTLMKCADLALYRAKEQGRNNYQFYTHEMTIKAKEKIDIKNALSQALEKNELFLHYQPQMEIKTRRITGLEALLRWNNENFAGIKPDVIIALAEESGLIIPVSEWILKTACEQLKKWHNMGFTSLTMAVNCTSRQFKQADFVENLKTIISVIDFPAALLEIEITEKMIMQDPEYTIHLLDSLKQAGFKIVIDDFGTGYWSIGNLRKLSVDKIKIDGTFIKKITEDETSADITSAIIAMVNKLGMISVAEGVETHEAFAYLAQEGCCEIQGYYLTYPLTAEAMTEFLQKPVPDAAVISVSDETLL